jgi:tryptophan-rich sensory protein
LRRELASLAGFLVVSFIVASLGGWVTASSVGTWYQGLAKPSFNPPDWVFGPVWTVLYALMAIAAWRVRASRTAMLFWSVQLALNLLWSVLFFGLRQIGLALAEIAVLWVAIAATALVFHRTDRLAAALMLPYLLWVCFAAVLNAAIWTLN